LLVLESPACSKANAPWLPWWLASRLHKGNKPTRISCHAAVNMAARASFRKKPHEVCQRHLDRNSGETAQATLKTKRTLHEGRRARLGWKNPPGSRVKRLGVAAEDLRRQAGQAPSLGGLSATTREMGDDQRKNDSNH
jgi:hypothetical protein